MVYYSKLPSWMKENTWFTLSLRASLSLHISRKNLKVFQIPIEKRCLLETGAVRGYSTQFQETALWTTSSWSNDCAISQSHDGAIRFGRFCRWNGVSTEAVIFWRIAIEIFLGDPVSGDFQASNH